MSLPAMRWVDHWIGLPLCFSLSLLVTVVRKLGLRRARTISGQRTIAVFKFFGLGSIIETTPLLRAIRKRYPQGRLAFVTFAGNEALVRGLKVCHDVRVIRTHSPLLFVLDVVRQIIWLHQQRVEAVVDLEFFSKFSTLLAFTSGAPIRAGFHLNDFWRSRLITHPVYFNYHRHITDVYRQVAERLDVEIVDPQLSRIATDERASRSVEEHLRRSGWSPDGPLLGLNINAGDLCLERRWPIDRFAALTEALLAKHTDLRIVVTGSMDEQPYVLSFVDLLSASIRDRVIVAAGQWSLDEFIAALSYFCGFVTNDSGPMHMAAAQGVPLVSLWGPQRPAFLAPRVPNHRAIYRDYHCSPCILMFTTFEGMWCNHEGWCMQEIEVREVIEAVESMLAERSTAAV